MFEKIMPRMFVYAYDPERIEEMLDRKSHEGWRCSSLFSPLWRLSASDV